MDRRDKQTAAVSGLTFVIGLLLGMIIMGVWGPYALERAREDRRAAAYQEHKKQEDLADKQFQEGFGKFMDDLDKRVIERTNKNREAQKANKIF